MTTSSGDWTTLVPVTGEAVALDLRLAQFPSRTLGLALDLLLQFVALLGLLWLSSSVADNLDSAAAKAIGLVSLVGIIVGMPTAIETLTRGRSVGKMAAGLRVVRDDGGPVRFRHSFVRALFMIVDFWLSGGSVGLISSLTSSRGKRLGDHFAGTVVVRERVPAAASLRQYAYGMPPQLEGWASTLDLTRLPDQTALQARQFLGRTTQLAPQVRTSMGLQLAAEFSAYLAPPPPPGIPAETYLAAVLTERMRRAARSVPVSPAPAPGAAPSWLPVPSDVGTSPGIGAGQGTSVAAPTDSATTPDDSGPFARPI